LAVGLFAVHKDSKVSPVSELLPKLKALRSSKKELRIFNLLPDSSELAFNNVKVFMMSKSSEKSNSSTSPLKQTISDDYLTLSRLQEGWSEVLNHWKFDVALLPKDSSLANILVETNNWRVLAESSTSYKNFYGVKREATKVLVVPNNY
jgi:hypothetical protein